MPNLINILFDEFIINVQSGKYLEKGIYWNNKFNSACYSEFVKEKALRGDYD